MNDELIVKGLCNSDEAITNEYFYKYCRYAYVIFDNKYHLSQKTGLDFYSLAHDYYIQLMVHGFKPLLDRPANVKLSTWMTNGFHFVVLDALKAYKKEFNKVSDTESDITDKVSSLGNSDDMMKQICEEISSYYHNDRMMQEIGSMLFYGGYSQKDIAAKLGISPAAVNQRYKKMMEDVVTPFVIANYSQGEPKSQYIIAPPQNHYQDDYSYNKPQFLCDFGAFSFKSSNIMNKHNVTPDHINALKPNEIFVFGSNLLGMHNGGAARTAYKCFGAEWGNGDGLQGQSYAIPTMQGDVSTIKPYTDKFIEFAKQHPELTFLVTSIGCGIAGFTPAEIAPLFRNALNISNIHLPESFLNVLDI